MESKTVASAAQECSGLLMEVVPPVMRRIRGEMRRHGMPELSVAQFRTLLFLRRHPGATLSQVAEFAGLSLPSTSKLVDKLVSSRTVTRRFGTKDRRRVSLALTERGRAALELARAKTQDRLAESLGSVPVRDLVTITAALKTLSDVFRPSENHGHIA